MPAWRTRPRMMHWELRLGTANVFVHGLPAASSHWSYVLVSVSQGIHEYLGCVSISHWMSAGIGMNEMRYLTQCEMAAESTHMFAASRRWRLSKDRLHFETLP